MTEHEVATLNELIDDYRSACRLLLRGRYLSEESILHTTVEMAVARTKLLNFAISIHPDKRATT